MITIKTDAKKTIARFDALEAKTEKALDRATKETAKRSQPPIKRHIVAVFAITGKVFKNKTSIKVADKGDKLALEYKGRPIPATFFKGFKPARAAKWADAPGRFVRMREKREKPGEKNNAESGFFVWMKKKPALQEYSWKIKKSQTFRFKPSEKNVTFFAILKKRQQPMLFTKNTEKNKLYAVTSLSIPAMIHEQEREVNKIVSEIFEKRLTHHLRRADDLLGTLGIPE